MKLKLPQHATSHVSFYDLLGRDERGLSKAFAYLLACNKHSLFAFLRFLGLKARSTTRTHRDISVEIERKHKEGFTDIEIARTGSFHVIIECKVRHGHVTRQRKQYLKCFEAVPQKLMCFITQERDTNLQNCDGVTIRNISWADILDVLEATSRNSQQVRGFMAFAIRTYRMRSQKEILVQDLSNPAELERYCKYAVYRRDVTFGTPLYFAPYFTQQVAPGCGKGICSLSRILGVLTLKPSEIEAYQSDLGSFSEKPDQVQKWVEGVKYGSDAQNTEEKTYYFLDEPVKLPCPLFKDRTIKKGRGKNWIAGMIPKNRCVTFAELIRRLAQHAANERS